ncbi:MAG: hypothetical protein LBL24_02815 [Bacteroidales bacterium]|jgi:hypothetical protein|nr:hypothetical protein [Bacteroidales bacterium]
MMNLLRRFVDVFRIDSIDMNALTGNDTTSGGNPARDVRGLYLSRQGKHINRKTSAAAGSKPRMGFHMMNLLIDMNALTGLPICRP